MIIYNVTVKIEHDLHEDWLNWMRHTHIPDVLATGLFTGHRISKVLGDDDAHGVTYAIQYECPDLDTFLQYQQQHAARLQADHARRYQDKYVAFRTLLEVVG
ncbi:MAG TPA: DUF4286 family protein [Saprospiraceae bacterium]|nr:DUF4286 family protein [Saprospiraceae bacterium]HRJ13388.1 DUF4286 family protein [Saprospiraceae bacterium]HRK82760.1 DUF4286 family protein [Saprospiraceae bacterium]